MLYPIRGDLSSMENGHFPWKFVLSMDERAHWSTHPTRLVERICIKFLETKFIPWNQRRISMNGVFFFKKKGPDSGYHLADSSYPPPLNSSHSANFDGISDLVI